MCGILFELCGVNFKTSKQDSEVLRRIQNRGPDCKNTVTLQLSSTCIKCSAAVLWLQGSEPVTQPLENDKGLLLYNGDILDWSWDPNRNDTLQIMDIFTNAENMNTEEIVNEIKKFKGPFSLIYFNKVTRELIFTRDKIGRNSLLFHSNNSDSFTISSVLGRSYDCIEIPATNIYVLNISTLRIKLYPWDKKTFDHEFDINEWVASVKLVQSLPDEHFSLESYPVLDTSQEVSVRRFIENSASETKDKHAIMQSLLNNLEIKEVLLQLLNLLDKSIEIRTKKQPMKCKHCLNSLMKCHHSSLGILFSGGLDCTLLAYLADKHLPKEQSIELINVAFKKDKSNYDVPDRVTGKQSLEELKQLCPQRNWIFKEVNVPNDILMKYQETTISDLVYPRKTILDESLGSALWFAAQGNDGITESTCRVLLLGSGADELFGGYTRHRNAYKRNGWSGLNKELLLDWKRIAFRNLARDNRVICDHGKQPRMPYLDEDFAQYVLDLKPWFKCFPSEDLGHGIGDKLMLRLIAFHLGLKNVAILPKRALQFGSRIANKKEKGSDLSKNLQVVTGNK